MRSVPDSIVRGWSETYFWVEPGSTCPQTEKRQRVRLAPWEAGLDDGRRASRHAVWFLLRVACHITQHSRALCAGDYLLRTAADPTERDQAKASLHKAEERFRRRVGAPTPVRVRGRDQRD